MSGVSAPPAHRATTAHLQAVYPFVSGGGLDGRGPFIGRDVFGGPFRYDPWDLYRRGILTNPNMVVMGQVGRGKSTFVKTFVWRQVAHGRQAWIVDPKGEYGPLVHAAGAVPIRLAPGGPHRLNPLEGDRVSGRIGPAQLTCSLIESSLRRALSPAERAAVDLAVLSVLEGADRPGPATRAACPTLADVVAALLDPDAVLAARVGTDAAGLASDGRAPALELRRLVEGDLAGLFDGPTTPGLRLDGPVVALDLSAVFHSPALALLMICATAWLQAILAGGGVKRLLVVDEAWAVLHDLGTARWLQATFKLSRSLGVANVAVVHRLSDLRAAGEDGSEQQRLAEGLLADAETRVMFGQSPSEAEACGDLLRLSSSERDLLSRLPRGVALWKVGERSFVVEHAVGRREAELVDTDAAMREVPG
jgi:hypothetical protein